MSDWEKRFDKIFPTNNFGGNTFAGYMHFSDRETKPLKAFISQEIEKAVEKTKGEEVKNMEQKPTIGRIVHYKIKSDDPEAIKANGNSTGNLLPAIIIRVWENEFGEGKYGLNLQIFTDGGGLVTRTSVPQGDEEGQWNWPARA